MYKTKLQELCQHRSWSLPVYETKREGQDHNPLFKSSVTVNGSFFHSSTTSKTSKESQNEAAKVAFECFTDDTRSISGVKGRLKDSPIKENPLDNNLDAEVTELHMYKIQLARLAQQRNIELPVYNYTREGPDHAPRFKSKVTIEGQDFESPMFFYTLKDAEHAAAQVALASLSEEGNREGESIIYKNLLQEMMQREGSSFPVYKTIKSGESHCPTFLSTVEVDGEIFSGKAAKTKKQAELNAAKVAFLLRKQREVGRELSSHSSGSDSSFSRLPDFADLEVPKDDVPSSGFTRQSSSYSLLEAPKRTSNSKQDFEEILNQIRLKGCEISPPADERAEFELNLVCKEPVDDTSILTSRSSTSSESSNLKVSDPENETIRMKYTASASNRVQVYPRTKHVKLPEGMTPLPISDDEWIAFSLDLN